MINLYIELFSLLGTTFMIKIYLASLTMGEWRLPAGHESIAKLNNLGYPNDALAVMSFIREKNQKVEH